MLTQKVVGGSLAIEGNPIARVLFRWFGFKKVRFGIFVVAFGFIVYYGVIHREIASIFTLCLIWLFVDGNNIWIWHRIKYEQRLKRSVIQGEIGFEDIHEL